MPERAIILPMRLSEDERRELTDAWRSSGKRGLSTFIRETAQQVIRQGRRAVPVELQCRIDEISLKLDRLIAAINRVSLPSNVETQHQQFGDILESVMKLRNDVRALLSQLRRRTDPRDSN